MGFLSLRLVGAVEARKMINSSSHWGPAVAWTRTQVLTIASPVFSPLSYPAILLVAISFVYSLDKSLSFCSWLSIIWLICSIQPEHATVANNKGVVKIKPVGNSKLLVNGQAVTKETALHHNDRVLFGNSHLYVFHSPQVWPKTASYTHPLLFIARPIPKYMVIN